MPVPVISIYLRRQGWVSFPLRIVSMNRSKSMMAMGDIIARGPIPKGAAERARRGIADARGDSCPAQVTASVLRHTGRPPPGWVLLQAGCLQ